ncbi:hypothetical protein [Streptomyces abikoensis]|uniref:hypothetical protein n=1 Tax=Streptomyces abikoensis TaxID=97398 RepID=UPI0016726568|nr:hypothetical protein [Streptomyces abikoensis]GGP55648.1 hypothetical protein GCM10010214_31050 [Streptomyces abikoensis]
MPWVRLDDRFASHRKVRMLSDRAFRLYVSGLCYASDNLTDGRIPAAELRIVADIRAGKAAAKELVERGLWENTDDGDFRIHDYLDYNFSADQVRAERQSKTARQAKWRANKKNRESDPEDTPAGADVDASTPTSTDASRDGAVAPAPYPSPSPSPPSEKEEKQASQDGPPPRIGDRPQIPDSCRPLVEALGSQRLVVGWDLQSGDWFLIEALIRRCGIPALVASATASWQGARKQPRSGRYFIPGWRALPDAPAEPQPSSLPAAVGANVIPFQPGPAAPATHNSSVLARARARLQEQPHDD